MSKKTLYTGIGVAVAIIVIGYFFFYGSSMNPFNNQEQGPSVPNLQGNPVSASDSVVTQDVKVGTGPIAQSGETVQVNYVGKLQDGTVFDQSANHNGPFTFTLGAGQVIPGWDEGILGMRVGGERVLIIPPSLGYGQQQVGPIPPNSTLVFDVTLLGVSSTTSSTLQ
ncbi:MAG: FKBP-type peptidyl-prolyl cis-trans isomerase [Patescibacteria group bacterium]|nr:FKBP-type peptidyl-prolyl cis-trans isomerase [Patescibacteria group bacterium]